MVCIITKRTFSLLLYYDCLQNILNFRLGRIGPESKTLAPLWLLMSAGKTLALKGLNNDLPMHDEPGPRLPQQLELKSVVLWTSLGVFNDLLLYICTELHAGSQ